MAKKEHEPWCLHDEPGVTICNCKPEEEEHLLDTHWSGADTWKEYLE